MYNIIAQSAKQASEREILRMKLMRFCGRILLAIDFIGFGFKRNCRVKIIPAFKNANLEEDYFF